MTGGTLFQSTAPGALQRRAAESRRPGTGRGLRRPARARRQPPRSPSSRTSTTTSTSASTTGSATSTAPRAGRSPRSTGRATRAWSAGRAGSGCSTRRRSLGRCSSRSIVHGQPSGSPSQVTPNDNFQHADYAITEDAAGRLTVGWFIVSANRPVRPELDRRPSLVGPAGDRADISISPSYLSLSAAGDGGGFAAFQEPEPGGATGSQIDVAAFGSFAATGLKGLGNLDGDGIGGLGGDPLGSTSCTDVHFGDIDALAEAGCFLRDPSNPNSGAAIIAGEIRLNGLEIIPDAGRRDRDRSRASTRSTRPARCASCSARRGSATSRCTTGELHLDLAGLPGRRRPDAVRRRRQQAHLVARGLPDRRHDRRPDRARLRRDPDLAEAAALHGRLSPARPRCWPTTRPACSSPRCTSGSPTSILGALEVKNLAIDYTQTGDEWAGSATIDIPAGTPVLRDRGRGPLRPGRLHDGLLQRQRAVPGGADLHRYLPRRVRRRL